MNILLACFGSEPMTTEFRPAPHIRFKATKRGRKKNSQKKEGEGFLSSLSGFSGDQELKEFCPFVCFQMVMYLIQMEVFFL